MKPTKKYISEKALKLFNENGFVNVRLQHIADTAFVSVGHLAYHFKNKDAIVAQLYNDWQREQNQLLNEYKAISLFAEVDTFIITQYSLHEKYAFFYLDTLEIIRAYPEIGVKYKKQLKLQQYQYLLMLKFSSARGALVSLQESELENLSWLLQNVIDKYIYTCKVQDMGATSDKLKVIVWSLLKPYFTPMGLAEYEQLKDILQANVQK